jgi:hypothetical protein
LQSCANEYPLSVDNFAIAGQTPGRFNIQHLKETKSTTYPLAIFMSPALLCIENFIGINHNQSPPFIHKPAQTCAIIRKRIY